MNNVSQPTPISLGELKARLLRLNTNPDSPFKIKEEGEYMTAFLNLVDKKWIEKFEKAGITKQFELLLHFDEVHHTVDYTEKSSNVEWNNGVPGITHSVKESVGNRQVYQKTITYGLSDESEQDQTFNSEKIAEPVFEIIRQSGWDLKKPAELGVPTIHFNFKIFLPLIIIVLILGFLIFLAQIALYFYIINQ